MARWCLTTRQPAASWLALTELERATFAEVAAEMYDQQRKAMNRGR
jgi:hypothetical protein